MRRVSLWDRVPRLELSFGRWRLPAWTTLGRAGAVTGAASFAITARVAGINATVIVAAIAASIASFVVWRLAGAHWRSGRYVLLEFAILACGATAGVTALFGAPVSAILDHWMVALAMCLAVGRLGCLCHGCCHGRRGRYGLHYPWLVPWNTEEGADRLFPVQAIEASILAILAIAGARLATGVPGTAASAIAAGYAVARFELENWRGDTRHHIGPLSHNQWWCIAVAGTVTWLGHRAIGASATTAIALLFTAHLLAGSACRTKRSPRDLE